MQRGHREAEDYFEWITFGAILLGVLQQLAIAQGATWYTQGAALYIVTLIFFNVLVGTLTLLVSRRRSKVAMWVLIALFVLVLSLTVLVIIQARRLLASDITWAALESIAQVVACVLLFTPSARRWMNREDEKA
jgi:hypothetical protein